MLTLTPNICRSKLIARTIENLPKRCNQTNIKPLKGLSTKDILCSKSVDEKQPEFFATAALESLYDYKAARQKVKGTLGILVRTETDLHKDTVFTILKFFPKEIDMLMPFLSDNGFDLRGKDRNGMSYLHWAVIVNHLGLAQLCYQQQYDLYQQPDNNGLTPYELARLFHNKAIISLFETHRNVENELVKSIQFDHRKICAKLSKYAKSEPNAFDIYEKLARGLVYNNKSSLIMADSPSSITLGELYGCEKRNYTPMLGAVQAVRFGPLNQPKIRFGTQSQNELFDKGYSRFLEELYIIRAFQGLFGSCVKGVSDLPDYEAFKARFSEDVSDVDSAIRQRIAREIRH